MLSNCFAVKVETATGTSCCEMSRFVPVTIISSISRRPSLDCEYTILGKETRPRTKNAPAIIKLVDFIIYLPR